MRTAVAIASVLAIISAGCGGEVPELKANTKSATPVGARQAGDCAGSERFVESAWVKCIVVVRGTRRSAIAEISNRLRREGFRVGCEDALGALEVVAIHDRTRIVASARHGAITFDESDGGKPLDVVDARFAPAGARRIPDNSVGLKINAGTFEPSSTPYPLPGASCPS